VARALLMNVLVMSTMPPHAKRPALAIALLASALANAGCAGHLYNVWRDASYNGAPMQTVLVLAPRPDPGERRIWEDAYVAGLQEHGIKATASWGLFPDGVPSSAQLAEAVQANGYDGLLVTSRLPDVTQSHYVPGEVRREPVTVQSPYTGGFYQVWESVREPGHIDVLEVVNFKTDLWSPAGGGRLVWSASTHTSKHVNPSMIRHNVERSILPSMRQAGVVPAQR